MQPKNIAFVGAICLTIGWLLASTLAPPVARLQSRPEREPQQQARAEDPAFAEQLQLRLRDLPPAPKTGRNPFLFGARPPIATTQDLPQEARVEPMAFAPTPPVGPLYSLSGIGISGDVRTAILSDGKDVRIVKVNDAIGGYTVLEITDSSVTLAAASGERHTLQLR